MAMQTDVKVTAPLTATGVFVDSGGQNMTYRTRIKAIYATCGASAGSVVITNGNGGSTLANIATPTAANAGYVSILVPDQGILAENGIYATITNTASVVVFYG